MGRWASSPFVIVLVLVLVGGGSCSNVNHVCEKVWWGLLVLPFRRCARLEHVKGYPNQISGDTGTSFDWV